MHRITAFLLVALVSVSAAGEAPSDGKAEARRYFHEGLEQTERGDLQSALTAFEAAHALHPHHSVLYNIAQAQLSLGRTVEAIHTFERFLAEGGDQAAGGRGNEVRALLEASRKRIGTLKITADTPERTRVWLDGSELLPAQLSQPLLLGIGKHQVLHATGAGYPVAVEVAITSAEMTELHIAAPAPPLARGEIAVACEVPGIAVTLDGAPAGTTPLTRPLLADRGPHHLAFSRPGYRTREVTLDVAADSATRVNCLAKVLTPLPDEARAGLRVESRPQDALVSIDGQPFAGGPLPGGAHVLRVERDGYVPYQRTITVPAGGSTRHAVVLQPTPASRLRAKAGAERRRNISLVLGGTGAALLTSSAGLLIWNQQRYERWDSQGRTDTRRIASLQRVDDASLGLALLGTGLAATAIWNFFSSEAADE